jgi:hypothetical protein
MEQNPWFFNLIGIIMAKLKNAVTPKGVLSWPYIAKPDTRYNPEGVYKTSIVVSAADAAPLMELCKTQFVEEYGQAKLAKANMPFEVNEESGEVTFKFKSKRQPTVYDAKGKVIKNVPQISSGTIAKIATAINPYATGINVGVSLYLNDVQVIELVEYGKGNVFGAEDGYEYEDDGSADVKEPSIGEKTDSDF